MSNNDKDNTPLNQAEQTTRRTRSTAQKTRKPNFIMRTINGWFNRLFGAVHDGSFSEQEELYASNRTKRDYIWNTIGIGSFGMTFPILTVVVTQLVGVEQAGMFSMAFVVGLLLMIVANYGLRSYQVSDITESHSFNDYQVNRFITCAIMLIAGALYCVIRGYGEEMFVISMGVYIFKMVDGLADVYEGRLQQVNKLYLAGISQTIRSVLVLIIFSLVLLITRNLSIACVAMAITAVLTLVIVTVPLALLETPKSPKLNRFSIKELFKQGFTVFIALFMYALIDSMPKFVIESMLSYDDQLYFNALYFPAEGILLTIGLVYKPQLVRFAKFWADKTTRKRFDLMIVAVIAAILVLTLVMIFLMGWIGLPVMSFLYGVDFEQFRSLCFIMLAAGGVIASIDFLYSIITVLRRQKEVLKLYVITFGFSLFVPVLLASQTGLPGVVVGYLIVMAILFVLLIWEYMNIRRSYSEKDAALLAEEITHKRPSEIRAERERLKSHRGRGVSKDKDK